jgi:dephospho-CoA kinase
VELFGLTGGIATGKSTVAQLFRQRGVEVLDADQVAREVVEPGRPALEAIAHRFPGVVGPKGQLDRAALGARIFADAGERAALNAIIHPRIQERVEAATRALAARGVPRVLYDAPLLIENRLHEAMRGVVLVVAPPEVQLQRLRSRDHLDEAQAQARLAAQLPLDQKRRFATWVVDNGGSLEATARQVDQVLAAMQALTPGGAAGSPGTP